MSAILSSYQQQFVLKIIYHTNARLHELYNLETSPQSSTLFVKSLRLELMRFHFE